MGQSKVGAWVKFVSARIRKTKNLILGTATPIQTDVAELWDLLNLLNEDAGFVMGREYSSRWRNCEEALPVIKGDVTFDDAALVWEYLKTPLPPKTEADERLVNLRMTLGAGEGQHHSDLPFTELDISATMTLEEIAQDKSFFKNNNPILRHTILRRRDVLEDLGLLEKVAVDVHPDPKAAWGTYPGLALDGLGLMTNLPFDRAYEAAEEFTKLLGLRTKAAGFIKNLLLQRICSSFAAGRSTAQMMLDKRPIEDEDDLEGLENALDGLSEPEAACLQIIVSELSRPEARDPKLGAVNYFLDEHRTGMAPAAKTWAEHGCIIFSQYYDTARWVASEIARAHPEQVVAVYAGAGKSGLYRGAEFSTVQREYIKDAVKRHEIKLVVATDAACEGLNLQTLGTLINVDLPWNPSKLEQRLGRIKRFGQARRTVDMLNLVYAKTRDEKVYGVLSRRLKDKFDIFGSLPDTIDDAWIDDVEELGDEMDKYIEKRAAAKSAFEIRYQSRDSVLPEKERWELCSKVLAKTELLEKLSEGW